MLDIGKEFQTIRASFQRKGQPLRVVSSLPLGVFKKQMHGSLRDPAIVKVTTTVDLRVTHSSGIPFAPCSYLVILLPVAQLPNHGPWGPHSCPPLYHLTLKLPTLKLSPLVSCSLPCEVSAPVGRCLPSTVINSSP